MKITPIFAEAFTDITLRQFPRNRFMPLSDEFPKLEKQLLAMAKKELAQAQDQMRFLARKTARGKVVSLHCVAFPARGTARWRSLAGLATDEPCRHC